MSLRMSVYVVIALCSMSITPTGIMATDQDLLWENLQSGDYIAIMRHAIAPGTGDPADFSIQDCATQRNLSDDGREQSLKIGERFRSNGIERARVFSSQWCRCKDTAKHIGLGSVTELPALNSFFSNREQGDPQTIALKQWLAIQDKVEPLVLVTHQVNITALTGVYPSSGEIVIIQLQADGNVVVAGEIKAN